MQNLPVIYAQTEKLTHVLNIYTINECFFISISGSEAFVYLGPVRP